MEQAVVVVEVSGAEALVRGRRATACGSCAGKSSCGTLGSWVERFAEMRVANPVGAKVGDDVTIDVPEGEFLRAALRLYGAPMVGFFLAGFTVRAVAMYADLPNAELCAAVAAIGGLFAVFLWIRNTDRGHKSGARIIRIRSRAINVPVVVANP
ncbi:MAG: positive regulator for alginate biosynthesis MucC [Zetaproteobacteria bacterium CG06_land_8_20_14_3_00_59_53]|nr:MAG: hypothetical protein AUK36_08270 [Zetaproteobacteria bacterium CG2_30_59_37]PIO90353.1 MAG: positive regulator for alginate biosynthesis MucC [Zetaproteobacteria bacterium CG23_combo_of_CG06-09_8_20_14_all_59_86]PIQ65080.1 MAG: positive regulator for alginate biosynthesis MucC [Zetaproteobacteria bacterium CG11_big_fil_rev_8_21_14_0_20_59_439]PIU70167.1 MAG: positive regulator for alginate biosynthesis MucC [Zetaproteobacteria bacterium CG06_land_8_20_14_3_00_59_53]PIU96138.1 MAG: posit